MTDLPNVERAVVYTPHPGDLVVLEVPNSCTAEQADTLKNLAETKFGAGVRVAVLAGARFTGVLRPVEVTA